MSGKIKIAQISDIHIGPEDTLYYGIDLRRNFQITLEHVIKENPDYIVFSGDQAYDLGELEAYQWLATILETVNIPYYFIPGNHDSVHRMSTAFQLDPFIKEKGQLYYKAELGGFPCFFLDSEPDMISENQLKWLQDEAEKLGSQKALLFVHHPPVLCDALFMDRKYPLRNIATVQDYLRGIPNITDIFVGHYHIEKIVHFDDKTCYLCPSTQMQISTDNPDFEIGKYEPGWRMIEWDGKEVQTQVYYNDIK